MTSNKKRLLDMTYIALMTALIAVCSWISIPFGEVPFTLQTFAVFATLLIIGGKRGTLATVLYMIIGAIGVPVFSGMRGGLGIIAGPTGGYIVGFIAMCIICFIGEKLSDKDVVKLASLVIGLFVMYAFGTVWFALIYAKGAAGFVYALTVCVIPYIIPDLVKLALAYLVAKLVKPLIKATV